MPGSAFECPLYLIVCNRGLRSDPGRKGSHIENAVGDLLAHFLIVEDAQLGDTCRLFLGNHGHHNGPVGGVERGRRFIEQQHRMGGDEAARNIDALLLAARKSRWRQAGSTAVQAG